MFQALSSTVASLEGSHGGRLDALNSEVQALEDSGTDQGVSSNAPSSQAIGPGEDSGSGIQGVWTNRDKMEALVLFPRGSSNGKVVHGSFSLLESGSLSWALVPFWAIR